VVRILRDQGVGRYSGIKKPPLPFFWAHRIGFKNAQKLKEQRGPGGPIFTDDRLCFRDLPKGFRERIDLILPRTVPFSILHLNHLVFAPSRETVPKLAIHLPWIVGG
jgi:hypothetical protein